MSRPDSGSTGAGAERRAIAKDVLVVLGAFLVAAVVVGAVWPHLVDPVVVKRTDVGLLTDEVALADRFDNVGWYTLLAAGFGVVLGAVLVAWRRTNEVVTLVAVVAGAFLAAWLSARLGTWWGPPDPNLVLAHAKVGTTAPDQVVLDASAAYLVWPVAALVGAAAVLWSTPSQRKPRDQADQPPDQPAAERAEEPRPDPLP